MRACAGYSCRPPHRTVKARVRDHRRAGIWTYNENELIINTMSDSPPDLKLNNGFFELEFELTDSDTNVTSESDCPESDNESNTAESLLGTEEPPEKKQRVFIGTWSPGPFTPSRFTFDAIVTGPAKEYVTSKALTGSDCFRLFFDSDLMSSIVEKINAFATTCGVKEYIDDTDSLCWTNVTVPEMYALLACLLLMGLVRKDKVEEYWATEPLTETPIFAQVFTQNRFLLLLRAMHLSCLQGSISPMQNHIVIAHLKRRFGELFHPSQELRIQTSFSLCDGVLLFQKPQQSSAGTQLISLSDVKTGYVLNFEVCTGSASDSAVATDSMFSVSMTLELVRPYLGKGHVLYTDDQHNSPGLFRYLHKLGTSACGPVRLAWMPSFNENLETEFLHTDMLLAVKRRNLEDLPLLSSVHSTSMAINGEGDEEPECEADYSRAMRSSKHQVANIDYADFGRTPLRWYHKSLLHLMATTVHNAFVIYQCRSQKTVTFHNFQLDLINQLLEINRPELGGTRTFGAAVDIPMRLTCRHFPQPLPQDSTVRSWCFVCQNTRTKTSCLVETSFMCMECQKPLCVVPCFEIYHTQKEY